MLTVGDTTFVVNKNKVVATETLGGDMPASHRSGYIFVKTTVGGGSEGVNAFPWYDISISKKDATSGIILSDSHSAPSHVYGYGDTEGLTYSYTGKAYHVLQALHIAAQAGQFYRALTGIWSSSHTSINDLTPDYGSRTSAVVLKIDHPGHIVEHGQDTDYATHSNDKGLLYHMSVPGGLIEFHHIDSAGAATDDEIISVNVEFDRARDTVSGFGQEADSISDLPIACEGGKVVKITGGEESDYDDYYVKFIRLGNPDAIGFGDGSWVECSATPWDAKKLDPLTMPHLLIRRQDDGGGTVTGYGNRYYFEWAPANIPPDINDGDGWDVRAAGDDLTNVDPSFVGEAITDLFFYNNRLGFLTKNQSVSLSSVGRYFNFWRTSILNLLDNDPIVTNVGDTATSALHFAIPFARELVIFGDTSQYSMSSSGVFGPRSVSIDKISEYTSGNLAKPVPLETTAVFAAASSVGEQVWQLFRQDEVSYNAVEATEAVPGFIGSSVVHLAASSIAGMIAAVTEDGKLFIQNYFRSGAQLVQQAWWELSIQDSSGIGHVDFMGTTMRVTLLKTGLTSTPQCAVVDIDFDSVSPVHMDYEISSSDLSVSPDYDSETDLTKYTLPYRASDTTQVKVFEGNALVVAHSVSSGSTNTDIFLQGDTTGTTYTLGLTFDFSVGLFAPQLKISTTSGGKAPLAGSRITVTKMDITHQASDTFEVTISSAYRPDKVYQSSGVIVGSSDLEALDGTSGTFTVPIHQPVDDLEITITDSSAGRLSLESIEWELQHRSRASTWVGR